MRNVHESRSGWPGLLGLLVLMTGPALAGEPIRLKTDREAISTASVPEGLTAREWLQALGEAFDLDVSFAPGFRDARIDLVVTDVGPEEALDRACDLAGLMWVALDERSVLVAEDTPQNRRRYEPQVVQTFYLENAGVRDMMTVLRTTMGAKSVVANDKLNALTVRDAAPRVALARRLVERHDRAPAILAVEVRLLWLGADAWKAMEKVDGGDTPPPRLTAATARTLESAGRIVARPTLSFADGERASLEIARLEGEAEGPDFSLALSGRLAPSDGAITLEALIQGASAADPAVPERRTLSSTARLRPGETWAIAGLLRAGREPSSEPGHLIVLLTPGIAAPSGIQTADRNPLPVGTESRLGLDPTER